MNTIAFRAGSTRDAVGRSISRVGSRVLRFLLLAVCVGSVAVASHIGDPSVALSRDAELATLLRGMAALKGLIVVAAVALLHWRFGLPIAPRIAAAYVACVGVMAGAATMVWQLDALLFAAMAFHGGLVAALVIAWRGDDLPTRRRVTG